MSETVSVTITHEGKYRFLVDFGDAINALIVDEPLPLGEGNGPAPTQMLLAAVANCLSASLLFSMQKFKQDASGMVSTATCIIDRNENNRQRVQQIDVSITLGKNANELEHLDRILGQFKEFCTVSQSIQTGIPINISVKDRTGALL